MISIIVPVLNEEKTIEKLLKNLNDLHGTKEIIVVDGGSEDSTVSIASKYAKTIRSQKGRSIQMNLGAEQASGDILWFVHSDSKIHLKSIEYIEKTIKDGTSGGGFSLYFYDYERLFMRLLAITSNMRARYLGLYFGDQGIFIKKDIFKKLNGYPNIPIMEDFEFSLRLKKQGKMKLLNIPIGTSGRRFKNGGAFKTLMLMHKMKILYTLGVSPEKLNKMYREVR